ncbi:CI repressor [Candidatus Dojkabacteria bacterium]|uniref:CI repressor n=1 Tax=Candidatus Dojkabacteria bacterium TaxID=2099670 RepID=A0A5C7JA58_9BACT|nr:MAG: CI repressor [Candidatus Dojkabacteria bacterium]
MTNRDDEGLRRVFSRVRPIELADRLGVTRSAVSQWVRVPLDRVPAVCAITGLSEFDVRPDHYRRSTQAIA